jgi:negative regulator of sigma E activity
LYLTRLMTKKLTPSATTEIVSVTVTVLAMWAAVEWLKRKTENPKAKETLRPGQIPEQKQAGDGTVTANEEGKPANGVAEEKKQSRSFFRWRSSKNSDPEKA